MSGSLTTIRPTTVSRNDAPALDELRGRVLVVDDEPLLLTAFARILRAAGFAPEVAPDGKVGMELLERSEFDVVVTDIAMPNLDGVEFLKAVRVRHPEIAVVLMTGKPSLQTAVGAIEHGAIHYLEKPVDRAKLEDVVDHGAQLARRARKRKQAFALLDRARAEMQSRAGHEEQLNQAFQSLWLAYQPIVSFRSTRIYGYEALLRAEHPTLSESAALLSAAEELGRVSEIGRRTRVLLAERIEASANSWWFVNVHPEDLVDEALYAADAPLSAVSRRVVLELTERAPWANVPDLRARLWQLRRLGYRIALADMGAGYSGLTSFAELEPDVVKIDRSLIRNVAADPTKRAVIESIRTLCDQLQILVIAEGVDSAAERDALVELGCDVMQGNQFARPSRELPGVNW